MTTTATTEATPGVTETRPELPFAPCADDAELLADAPAEVKERFTINSQRAAEWLLRKLFHCDAEKALVLSQAAQRAKEIDADRARLLVLFGSQLEQWGKEEKERRKRQTVTLMYGDLVYRNQGAALRLVDLDAALPHALARGLVTTVPAQTKVDSGAYVAAAKAALDGEGEILPGVERVAARETFAVKFKSPAVPEPPQQAEQSEPVEVPLGE
jgi:hypothetical protein